MRDRLVASANGSDWTEKEKRSGATFWNLEYMLLRGSGRLNDTYADYDVESDSKSKKLR